MYRLEMTPTRRLTQMGLHQVFLEALEGSVERHGSLDAKPFEVDLAYPLPRKLRIYLFNLTNPPGGRAIGEYKIQLILPGQNRGVRGEFDLTGERVPILTGYHSELDVFVLWDAHCYPEFAYSRNVQVKAETVCNALGSGVGAQERRIKGMGRETVIAAHSSKLSLALSQRMEMTLRRVTAI